LALQSRADGHADDGERSECSDNTGQSGSHAGSSDDNFDATVASAGGKLLNLARSAVSAECVHLERHPESFEESASFADNGQVAGAAHDNAY
jgi:hypothetical protein